MDPITQGVVGATAAQTTSSRQTLGCATLLGIAGGMAPDLDILIRSSSDPLLALEFHRQFTHSLIFIPLGALIVAGVLHLLFARRYLSFGLSYLFSIAGYATHAVLDACTTYGTLLLWPFSYARITWNVISVVDPLFTVPVVLLILIALVKRDRRWSFFAIGYMLFYLSLGWVQNQRAMGAAMKLAESRGHQPNRLGVKPSFANIVVWKSIYQHEGRYYVDAIRVLFDQSVYTGSSTARLDLTQHFPNLDNHSQQARDIERFRWFSNGYLGMDPENSRRIIDIRYSLVPNKMTGMWGIEIAQHAGVDDHALYTTSRPQGDEINTSVSELWAMVRGDDVSRP